MNSKLIEDIRKSQSKLGLTNRAVLKLTGLATTDEGCFFAGQLSEDAYTSTNQALATIKDHLAQQSVPLSAYLQQLRGLPLHNIFLRFGWLTLLMPVALKMI